MVNRCVFLIGLWVLCSCVGLPSGLAESDTHREARGYGVLNTGAENASLPILFSHAHLIVVGSEQECYSMRRPKINPYPFNIICLKIDEIIGTIWSPEKLKSHIKQNEKGEQFLYILVPWPNDPGAPLIHKEGKYLIFLESAPDPTYFVSQRRLTRTLKVKHYNREKDKLEEVVIPKTQCFYVFGRWLGVFLISDYKELPVYKSLIKEHGEDYDPFSAEKRLFKDSFDLDLKDAPELAKATRTFCRILELDKEDETVKAELTELTKHEKRLYSEPAKRMLKEDIKKWKRFIKQPQTEDKDKKPNETNENSTPENKPKSPDK